jgi:transcription initiation factor TFIID subunit 12
METADEFVDNVITAACRLAKLRDDQTLEIRDIQLVLERNYNIRIPGFALDEIRLVRKVNPAPAWSQKMNAINAAKVMGGKPDA